MVDARDVRELLDERPELEPAVRQLLEADEPWTFDDVAIDSGQFGELVSSGVVERDGDRYRVADRAAVERALAGDVADESDNSLTPETPTVSLPDRRTLLAVTGALAFVAALRSLPVPAVFRDGDVVLTGNDPYFYRFQVERLLAAPDASLGSLPPVVQRGEPLYVATMWTATELFGGTVETASWVLAWYPVVSALVTGVAVFLLADAITDDRRVAVASVVFLGAIPGHAFRTSLGFADHHAFDYLWLVLTALAVTLLVREMAGDGHSGAGDPRLGVVAAGVGGVAVGVAGQTLAWEAGPLLLVALGVFLAVDPLLAVRADRAPIRTAGPVLLGVVLGAGATWLVHDALGWHTTLVAGAPALLAAGGVVTVGVATVARRLDAPVLGVAGVELVAVGGLVAAFATLAPDLWARTVRNVDERLIRSDPIAETGGLFGESAGWLLLFGLVFLFAVPYVAWGARRALDEPTWLPTVVYAGYFTLLAVLQIRFVGQMAPFVAVFAGLGFVHLAERVDLTDRRPAPFADHDRIRSIGRPDARQFGYLTLLFVMIAGLTFVQVPIQTGQLAYSDGQYETATRIADDAADRGLTYPDSYVFTPWSENRFYNYVVSGQSESYGFARSQYSQFALGTDGAAWYDRLQGRAGYVLTVPGVVVNESTLGTRLHEHHGSRTDAASGLGHYRLLFVGPEGEQKAFELVPGARLRGTAAPNTTVAVRTEVTVGETTFTYERRAETAADGQFTVLVAYPGAYTVGNETVTVSESAVRNGTTVNATA